jgi:SAM-dependent methyltransferase
VLVDFDQSILLESEVLSESGQSPIKRGKSNSLKKMLVLRLFPSNTVAAKNVMRFLELLKQDISNPTVLVVGGATTGSGTKALYEDPAIRLIAFDIYATPLTQFIADAHTSPLAANSVDAVWIQAVLEHVLDPWRVVAEIYRVLKPGGLVYAETPFMQPVHEGPYDFTRFTDSGHRWLFRKFELIDSGVVLGSAAQLLDSVEHITRGLFRSVYAGRVAKAALFWLRYADKIVMEAYAIDNASAVFFLGRRSDGEICPRNMISYYKGAHRRRTPT